jgi:hypothetical protein
MKLFAVCLEFNHKIFHHTIKPTFENNFFGPKGGLGQFSVNLWQVQNKSDCKIDFFSPVNPWTNKSFTAPYCVFPSFGGVHHLLK